MKLTTFIDDGVFYKANFHAHSTNSDGKLSQPDAVAVYKDNGYNFLCLSEHNRITKTDIYDTDTFKLVPGMELHSSIDKPLRIHHLVGITTMTNDLIHDAMRLENIPYVDNEKSLLELEKTLIDLNMLTIYCHPTWSRMQTHEFDFLKHTNIMEVYNYGTVYEQNHNNDPAYWDGWIRQGKNIWAMANDDGHKREHFLGGWNMVKCKEFTIESMLDSLKDGSFYATSGPEIYDFYMQGDIAYVQCSPAKCVSFVVMDKWGHCYRDYKCNLTEVEHQVSSAAFMIRVEIVDKDNNTAWSNPIIRKDRMELAGR